MTFVDALSPVPRQGIRAARTNPRLKTTVPARVTDRIKHGLDSWEVQEGFMAQYKEMQILLSFKPFLCYHRFFFFPSLGVRLNSAFRVRKLTQSAAATWPRLLCFPVGACGHGCLTGSLCRLSFVLRRLSLHPFEPGAHSGRATLPGCLGILLLFTPRVLCVRTPLRPGYIGMTLRREWELGPACWHDQIPNASCAKIRSISLW